MSETVVVLVNGEVLANGYGPTISDQLRNAKALGESLLPLLCTNWKIAILHGNKPQVGFVLFRSEIASHILHSIPLDVCGADTQGATGYMLSQAFLNVLNSCGINRQVMCVLTQTVVDTHDPFFSKPTKAIGPCFDRDRAHQYSQTRGWHIIEEPGRGYRRAVPSPTPIEIVEIEGIKRLIESGVIVVTAGGGGIPVVRRETGALEGIEAVVDTDRVACMIANQLKAKLMLMIIENDDKFILSRLSTESDMHLTLEELEEVLVKRNLNSNTVKAKLHSAAEFLHSGGEQVVITTLRKLPLTLAGESGLRIGAVNTSIRFGCR